MRKGMALGLALATGLLWAGGVQGQAPSGQLEITGTSSVRPWKCTESSYSSDVKAPANFGQAVVTGEKVDAQISLTFPVEKIDCHNGKMDEHMRKALKAKAHPTITYTMKTYDLGAAADSGAVSVTVQGEMTIAGQTEPVSLKALVTKAPDGGVRVQGEEPITMTAFHVKPPTLLFGTLKVAPLVHVKFDVVLKPGAVALGQASGAK